MTFNRPDLTADYTDFGIRVLGSGRRGDLATAPRHREL